jgi:hypothetical protein
MLQYGTKKKRTRDPSLPPPPTLLGQVKELRITRENIDSLAARISDLEQENHRLTNRLVHMESRITRILNHIRHDKKN